MHVSSISSGSYQAIGAGIRAQMKAEVMQTTLSDAGLLDKNLADGLVALQTQGQQVTSAGLEAARLDMVGALIDALA